MYIDVNILELGYIDVNIFELGHLLCLHVFRILLFCFSGSLVPRSGETPFLDFTLRLRVQAWAEGDSDSPNGKGER